MNLATLRAPVGARATRFRRGRGESSGAGKTAGRGAKGQGARTGGQKRPGFEGGQTPLHRRLPKFGFTNVFRIDRAIVRLSDLEKFEAGAVVDFEALRKMGILRKKFDGRVKVLGNGELTKALTVKAHAFTKTALAAIEKAGGKTEIVS